MSRNSSEEALLKSEILPQKKQSDVKIASNYYKARVRKQRKKEVKLATKESNDYVMPAPKMPVLKTASDITTLPKVTNTFIKNIATVPRLMTRTTHIDYFGKSPKYSIVSISDLKDDEDYKFLMEQLPILRKIPSTRKEQAKKEILGLVQQSLLENNISNRTSTNIYRDCGVLPISGGWKF
ncbi:hypothetical protein CEXT_302111 [Caerostris extrusa]|uniref:BESS domain-containing protein n=1 Tax=Caerostris extrusa TaxID=172846 RepID=A0AAV4P7M9_CAEEX|nr:hypothetical protein CEXT_302111 [Caerostris extrusa]